MSERDCLTRRRTYSRYIIKLTAVLAVGILMISPAHADQNGEVKMGKQAEAQIAQSVKFVTDPAVVQRVQSIFSRLAAVADTVQVPAGFGNDELYKFDYRIKIIDSKEVNAFSLPGGAIYIYKGLLDLLRGDDEVAAVLGHEIAHAAHHHVALLTHVQNQMSTQMALGVLVAVLAKVPADAIGGLATTAQYAQLARLNNHFSESAEKDADHTGMVYMVKAGFNPLGMLALLQRLQDVEQRSPSMDMGFLQDHPLTPDRITSANNELGELGYKLDQAMLWKVSDSMQTRVTDVMSNGHPAIKVSFGSRSIAIISPANRQEALDAAGTLDKLLIANGQGYQVKYDGTVVYVDGASIFDFTPNDALLQPVKTSPQEMAQVAVDIIKQGLWEVSVRGLMAQ